MNTETLKEPLLLLKNGQDQRQLLTAENNLVLSQHEDQRQEEAKEEPILLSGKGSDSREQSNGATVRASQPQPPAHTHVINVGGHQCNQKKPFIIDDYLGPYFTPEGFEIQFTRLEPYLRFRLDILNENLEGKWYKLYQVYLLLICSLHLVPAGFFFLLFNNFERDPVLVTVSPVVVVHFGWVLWQSYHEYKAVENKNEILSKKSIFYMKTLYLVLTFLLICAAITAIFFGYLTGGLLFILIFYLALFVLHLSITLVGAYKVEGILTKMRKLTNHLNNFTHLKSPLANDQERYKALFDILYRLSEKNVLFPISNKYEKQVKDNKKEDAEVAEALKAVFEHLPKMG